MKTIKQISKILLAILILTSFVNDSFADERKETFEKTYKLKSTGNFDFSCYDSDLKINTWNKDEVKLTGEIVIQGGKTEDQDKLIEVFANPEVSESSNSLKIETDMAKSTIIIGPIKKITLVNGKTIRVDKYKANYTLWIPESVALKLKSKYNTIDIATLTSELNFDLYEVDLTLASFKKGVFKMKYSSAEIGTGETARFDVYECELEIKDIKTFSTNSKYSKFNVGNSEMVAVGSYNDKFNFSNLSKGLTGIAKYSNFILNSDIAFLKMDVYESDITVKNIQRLVYSSKYSSLTSLNINTAKCGILYQTKIFAGDVDSFSCTESKYDKMEFKSISKSIKFGTAYELKLKITRAKSTLESFAGEFKYGYVIMPLDSDLDFSLNYRASYGKINFPKDKLRIKEMDIESSSKHSFEGSTSDNPACTINFESYETDFTFQ
jgi:hypothetical protein